MEMSHRFRKLKDFLEITWTSLRWRFLASWRRKAQSNSQGYLAGFATSNWSKRSSKLVQIISRKSLKVNLNLFLREIPRRQGFWLRCLLCWAIGCLAVTTDEKSSYDHRFQLRGDQKVSTQVVVIQISASDFTQASMHSLSGAMKHLLDQGQDLSELSDSYFWDRNFWSHLLQIILAQNPRSIGVTSFFPEVTTDFQPQLMGARDRATFQNPKVFWGAPSSHLDRLDRIINQTLAQKLNLQANPSLLSDFFENNVSAIDLPRDQDGFVRRVFSQGTEGEMLIEKLTEKKLPDSPGGALINFRGGAHVFPTFTLKEIFSRNLPTDAFLNKVVLIGTEGGSQSLFLTPVGPMHKVFIMAQIVDNLLKNRWIKRWHFTWYAVLMFLWMMVSVFIITHYPQSVALYFFIWIATVMAALSAWVFDSFNVWLPAFSPFVLLGTTWIVFIGYQASKIEKLHSRLKQEQKALHDLEQLKNNFVSLISHDLKTPIAKIQAIVERLLSTHPDPELQPDLFSLRESGDELNRYIRSILKVLRVEARDFKLHTEVVDINTLIDGVLTQVRPLAQEKNIQIIRELETMFSMELDPTLIQEVILNLVENALKYSAPGGRVTVKSEEVENQVHVEVRDQGEGILPEELLTVWNKFTRGKDQDFKSKGTGLGLYLVKFFIELHGGRVHIESEYGKGTSVHFYLPV